MVMDRSMINDTLNLLWVAVAYEGRALPLGWVQVPHEGNSNLEQHRASLERISCHLQRHRIAAKPKQCCKVIFRYRRL